MSLTKVNSALIQAWVNAFPLIPTAFPNFSFTPPDAGIYAALNVVPALNVAATLGSTGEDEDSGYFQVSIFGESDSGTAAMTDLIDQVKVVFKNGKGFVFDGQTVLMRSSRTPPLIPLNGREVMIIQINWSTRTKRIE